MNIKNQGKRGPDKISDRLLASVFTGLLHSITGLPKRALRYQFDKRGYKLYNVNDVVLYLKEVLG